MFIAVKSTPSRREDGHADLSYVYEAAREIAATMIDFTVVIVKSTVPVGTCDEIRRIIHHERPQAQWYQIPSFWREGAAIRDFKFPDRIVVGCDDERAKKVLADIYRPLSLNQVPIFYTSRRLEIVAKSLPTPLRRFRTADQTGHYRTLPNRSLSHR